MAAKVPLCGPLAQSPARYRAGYAGRFSRANRARRSDIVGSRRTTRRWTARRVTVTIARSDPPQNAGTPNCSTGAGCAGVTRICVPVMKAIQIRGGTEADECCIEAAIAPSSTKVVTGQPIRNTRRLHQVASVGRC